MSKQDGIVYSTEFGRMCPHCSQPTDNCICKKDQPQLPADSVVRIAREKKGRKGKVVCVITGIPLKSAELKRLARELKIKCGCGGTVKDGTIEIQGDKRENLIRQLIAKGFNAKAAGG